MSTTTGNFDNTTTKQGDSVEGYSSIRKELINQLTIEILDFHDVDAKASIIIVFERVLNGIRISFIFAVPAHNSRLTTLYKVLFCHSDSV